MAYYRIEIPDWHPVRTNQWAGRHWSRKHKFRKQQSNMIGHYAREAGVPDATGPRKVMLALFGWKSGKLPDEDAYDKLLLDSLVECHLLLDDSRAGLVGRVEVYLERDRRRSTIIELEDVLVAR